MLVVGWAGAGPSLQPLHGPLPPAAAEKLQQTPAATVSIGTRLQQQTPPWFGVCAAPGEGDVYLGCGGSTGLQTLPSAADLFLKGV